MTKSQFKFAFGKKHGVSFFTLIPGVTVFRKPLQIWIEETNQEIRFKTIDELLDYQLDGAKVIDIISGMESLSGDMNLYGGRGGESSPQGEYRFSGASDTNLGRDIRRLPAEANTKIKTKTYEEALKQFQTKFANSDHEYAYEIDRQGYVHAFNEGGKHAVNVANMTSRNNIIVHNHPSGGHFSDADLLNMAQTRTSGVVAVGNKKTYTVTKNGGHFKATEFTKAVKTAKMKGKDYDDAVHKFLKANQKKYGYTYTRTNTPSK